MNTSERTWQLALSKAFRTFSGLCDAVGVTPAEIRASGEMFPVLVPQSYAERMEWGNPADPLLKQVALSPEEFHPDPAASLDPVGEHQLLRDDGIIQKYNGRALVVTTGSCAVHCRYCFRRHFPYEDQGARLGPAVEWLRRHEDVKEVILSGGDPLVMTNARLQAWLTQLDTIPHLRLIRLHSRVPIVLPERMTDELIELLTAPTKRRILVVHANHAHELSGLCADRLKVCTSRGLTTLNQSVLLAGVNDSVEAIGNLSWRLVDLGIIPYYLHQLDRVAGAGHFAVSDQRAAELVEQVRQSLPGYLVPRLVREVTGEPSKSPLF